MDISSLTKTYIENFIKERMNFSIKMFLGSCLQYRVQSWTNNGNTGLAIYRIVKKFENEFTLHENTRP